MGPLMSLSAASTQAGGIPVVSSSPLTRAAMVTFGLALALSPPVVAQTPPQQYVYDSLPTSATSSNITGYLKNAETGALGAIAASPFGDRLQGSAMAIDALGRFLFVVNRITSNISMFQIDSATGNLTEVAGSPFSTGVTENPNMAPTSPVCIAAEKSGRFLYVGYQNGNFQGRGAINEYLIDAVSLQLLPLPGQPTLDITSSPIAIFADPKGLHLYVGLGLNQSTGMQDAGTDVYSIDSSNGQLAFTGSAGNALNSGRNIALDSKGRFFFDGWGASQTFLDSALISPADGTATSGVMTLALASGDAPVAMLTESSGKFLYVQQFSGAFIYSIDQVSGALAQGPPVSVLNFKTGTAATDPLGPYLYSLQNDGVHAFLIDSQTGGLTEISGSPYSLGSGGSGPLTISGAPVQAISGPAVALFPSSEDFGGVTLGQSSNSRLVTLTNTGDQALSVNSIALGGANPADYTATPTCTPPTLLQPNATCTISVVFSPTQTGARTATLSASDNASGSPQSITLVGQGLAAQPAVTLVPGTLTFAATTQGITTPAQTITLTSAGSATLHISSVLLGGSNPSDFSMTNTCSGALAPNATCTINVTFTPIGAGSRTAVVTISDDAPNSPQNVALSGTGIAAQPAATIVPSGVAFPATTQGSSSTPQTITLTSSGSTTLHVASVVLGGANPPDFTMNSTCVGAYSPTANCTITLTFAPLTAGSRSAEISISDDAPDSPQTILLSGNANAAFTISGTSANGLAAAISAGQTATYSLQLIPNAGFTGSVSFGCTGAPSAATCSAPSVQVANSNPVPFTVSVSTTGSTLVIPVVPSPKVYFPPAGLEVAILILLVLFLFLVLPKNLRSRRLVLGSVPLAMLLLMTLFHAVGCGGGAGVAPAQTVTHIVTPQGTSTLTVAPSAMSASGKPLELTPIHLTLTVQ